MIETALLFSRYLNWNDNGVPSIPVTVFAQIFGSLKRSLSRILVQLVSLGYGVVRPSIGDDLYKVVFLGASYFIFSLIYSLIITMPNNSKSVETEYDFLSIIVLILAGIDTTFYIWIFTSINNLLFSLASRKQGSKYLLYRNFRAILFGLLFLTCIWALYSSILFINDGGGINKNWREKWTIDALWELIYFVIMVAICVLWAPSKNSQRYAYSIELTQLDDDNEFNSAAKGELDNVFEYNEEDLDDEYGGKLSDEKDPFKGTGALDPAMAINKKQ